jgi:hypothetical protein
MFKNTLSDYAYCFNSLLRVDSQNNDMTRELILSCADGNTEEQTLGANSSDGGLGELCAIRSDSRRRLKALKTFSTESPAAAHDADSTVCGAKCCYLPVFCA